MGYKTVERVMKSSRAKGSARLILMVLATHANDDSLLCHPSRELLCEEAAMEERNLIYSLKQLETIGELRIIRGSGRGNLSAYQLVLGGQERVQNLVTETPRKGAEIGEKGCNSSQERVQDLAAEAPIEAERVQDLEQRVQDSVRKGAESGDAYKDIEPSGTVKEPKKDMSGKPDRALSPTSVSGPVWEVFTYWQARLNHPQAHLTDKRRKQIQARLEEKYTVDDIKRAIDGCASSPWHMGANDRNTVFDDIELICRSGEKLEGFIAKVRPTMTAPTLSAFSPAAQQTIAAGEAFVRRMTERGNS